MKVTILTYDVWGNPDDGFQVNETFVHAIVEYDGTPDDLANDVVPFLNKHFFREPARALALVITAATDTDWEVEDALTARPICGLSIWCEEVNNESEV